MDKYWRAYNVYSGITFTSEEERSSFQTGKNFDKIREESQLMSGHQLYIIIEANGTHEIFSHLIFIWNYDIDSEIDET